LKINFKIKINKFIVIKTHVRSLLSTYRIIFNRLEFMHESLAREFEFVNHQIQRSDIPGQNG